MKIIILKYQHAKPKYTMENWYKKYVHRNAEGASKML